MQQGNVCLRWATKISSLDIFKDNSEHTKDDVVLCQLLSLKIFSRAGCSFCFEFLTCNCLKGEVVIDLEQI